MRRFAPRVVGFLLALGLGLVAFALFYLARPLPGFPYDAGGRFYDLGQASRRVAFARSAERRLKILTWNIAYAYGAGSEAYHFTPRAKEAFAERLERIAAKICELDADVVLLQEVDFRSRRSHGQDQLAYLKRACGYAHAAGAVSWSARFVPYPPWPLERQVGPVASGGGILSRLPLADHEVRYHAQPAANPFWYNAFYPRRYTQSATLSAFGRSFVVLNNHLEDADPSARAAGIEALAHAAAAAEPPLVMAGDFNASHSEDAMRRLRGVASLSDALHTQGIPDDGGFTFPSAQPTVRLDHVFVRQDVEIEAAEIIQAGDLSDHLPVIVTLVIRDS